MEPQNKEVGRKFFGYTMAMFTVPIFVFYLFHDYLLRGESGRTGSHSFTVPLRAIVHQREPRR
jgi:hypothetical protein